MRSRGPLLANEKGLGIAKLHAGQCAAINAASINVDAVGFDLWPILWRMTMNNDRAVVFGGEQKAIAYPQKRFVILLIKRNVGINASMAEEIAVLCVRSWEAFSPRQSLVRDSAAETFKRRATAIADPPIPISAIVVDVRHHIFVIALERHDLNAFGLIVAHHLNDALAVGASVDVVAEKHNGVTGHGRNPAEQRFKRFGATVNVPDCVDHDTGPSKQSLEAGKVQRTMKPTNTCTYLTPLFLGESLSLSWVVKKSDRDRALPCFRACSIRG
jgi:hypothetical protein